MDKDYKAAAAGDNSLQHENELNKNQEKHSQRQKEILEYAAMALEFLLSFTQTTMEVADHQMWIKRLSIVPLWKLKKLDEFVGPRITDVWKFFSELRPEPESFNEEPTGKRAPGSKYLPDPELSDSERSRAIGRFYAKRIAEIDKIEFKPTVWHKHNPKEYQRQREEWRRKCRLAEWAMYQEAWQRFPSIREQIETVMKEPRFMEIRDDEKKI